MKLIEAFLNEEYDIIALQEVGNAGFTGSGVCIFSRYTIISALMHRYSLNGFAHHIHRGDWFGGKVVGMVEISFHDCRINFYNTHLHAEYNRMNDLYLPHRLSQAVELSQFIKYTSKGADLVILTGLLFFKIFQALQFAQIFLALFLCGFILQATLFRFLITFVIAFCLWYGFIGLTMELKALKAAKSILMLLLKE
ncbi:unnamed protein product [Dracunculus medinensis]|uniref:sphingomyelin phosphodiesterase n=1 Tax=Dracunculus medinensis TaxID=318479 RepID=A0A0N4UA42_DRAME|nr:unnamed protein product [Dracunculus medinensis]